MTATAPGLGEYAPRGDMGLGLCLYCLAAAKQAEPGQARPAEFAIALIPHLQPFPQGMVGVVAVGACWDHIGGAPQQQQRRPLLVAEGSVPR